MSLIELKLSKFCHSFRELWVAVLTMQKRGVDRIQNGVQHLDPIAFVQSLVGPAHQPLDLKMS